MSLIKPRRIIAVLGAIVLVVGCYVGWQMYKGQQMANQYANDAQKLAQGSGNSPQSENSQTQSTNELPSVASPDQTPPSGDSASQAPSPPASSTPGAQPNSNVPSPPPVTPAASEDYKLLMSKTYQQALQVMQNVKSNTLALQGRNISLSSYKSSILQSQATLSSAEAFVRANPPTDTKLNPSYQEFLAGISLAKQSMGVVLNGISSFSASNFYAAREMGKTAQQQVVNGYSHF